MDSNNATTNNDNINSTATRKRRLSKKERKSMKKKQKSEQKANEPKRVLNQEDVNQQCHDESSEEREKEIQEEIELMNSYKPISAPKTVSSEIEASKKSNIGPNNDIDEGGSGGGGEKKLGTWFPNALLVKCTYGYTNTGKLVYTGPKKEDIDEQDDPKSAPKSSILLFYQYTKNKWSPDQVKLLMTYFSILAKQRNLGGRIRVAQEGVNATLSAIDMPFRNGLSAKEILRHVAQDLKNFDSEVFTSKTDFKFIDDLPADRHFKEMKIIPVQELVYYGIREEDASCNQGGIHLDAKEYHKMLQKDNAVVIDVRNHYETNLGRFDGQESKKSIESGKGEGAEYIDPKMRKSTDFTAWLAKPETKKKLENKTVLMYCTGGIRCERASAYLKKKMGNEVEGIYQLQGGIERYLKAFPSGKFTFSFMIITLLCLLIFIVSLLLLSFCQVDFGEDLISCLTRERQYQYKRRTDVGVLFVRNYRRRVKAMLVPNLSAVFVERSGIDT